MDQALVKRNKRKKASLYRSTREEENIISERKRRSRIVVPFFNWEHSLGSFALLAYYYNFFFVLTLSFRYWSSTPTGPIKYKKLVLHLMLSLLPPKSSTFFSCSLLRVPKEQKNYSWKSAFLRIRCEAKLANVKQTKSWGNLSFQSV